MGTRSAVYARTESGTKGIYVHFDGYPESRLPCLTELIRRDGVSRVVATLMARPSGWSGLNDEQTSEMPDMYNDGRFEAVPGYGIQYTDTEFIDPFSNKVTQQGNTEYMTTDGEDRSNCWIEYVYVIELDGSISWAVNQEVPWDQLEWQTLPVAAMLDAMTGE